MPRLLVLVLLACLAGLLAGSVLRTVRERTLIEVDLTDGASLPESLGQAVALAEREEATVLLVRSTQPVEELLVTGARPAGRPETGPAQPVPVPSIPPNLTVAAVGPNSGRGSIMGLLGVARQDAGDGLALLRTHQRAFNWPLTFVATTLTFAALALRTRRIWPGGGRDPLPSDPAPQRSPRRGPDPVPTHTPAVSMPAAGRPPAAPHSPRFRPAPSQREQRIGTVRTPLIDGGYVEVDKVLFWARADPATEYQLLPGVHVQVAPDGQGGCTAWPVEPAAHGLQQPHERPLP